MGVFLALSSALGLGLFFAIALSAEILDCNVAFTCDIEDYFGGPITVVPLYWALISGFGSVPAIILLWKKSVIGIYVAYGALILLAISAMYDFYVYEVEPNGLIQVLSIPIAVVLFTSHRQIANSAP